MEMYKFSNYNIVVSHKENILLYNTLNGLDSMCKMPYSYKDCFDTFKAENFNEEQFEKLCAKGYIVSENFDELSKLNCIAIDGINNNNSLSLLINPTEMCNFRCKYCYESYKNGAMSKDIQNKIINFVRHNINKFNSLKITWFGGEPLLALDVIEYLSYHFKDICSKNKKQYSAGISTNGFLLNIETFEKLLDMNVFEYQVTLDGYKEIHDRQRVAIGDKPTFDIVYNNLLNIKQSKKKNFVITVRINFTKDSFNDIDNVFKIISFIEDDTRFLLSPCIAGNFLNTIDSSIENSLINGSETMLILKKIYEYPKKIHMSFHYDVGGQLCYAFKKNCFHISSTGKIGKCTVAYEDINHVVGEIRNARFVPNETYYDWVAKFDCDYKNCKFAPICLGFLCKVIDKNSVCNRSIGVIEQMLKILDKNDKIKSL